MTTFRQIEANRRNALKSTGPKTTAGKERSRRNAVRHGLTAETFIGMLEDAEDYRQFEAAVIADYDAQSAVERELALRLASLLWRLRRATTMETGLFEIQAGYLREYRQNRQLLPDCREAMYAMSQRAESVNAHAPSYNGVNKIEGMVGSGMKVDDSTIEFARSFLRLANLPNFALGQILLALDALDRCKPQERRPLFRLDDNRPERPKSDKW
jgi:hypothetical protein